MLDVSIAFSLPFQPLFSKETADVIQQVFSNLKKLCFLFKPSGGVIADS